MRTRTVVSILAIAAIMVGVTTACGSQSASPSGGGSAASSAAASPTSTDPTVAVVGLTEEEAQKWATDNGYTLRVVERDGQQLPATKDYREDRINVVVSGGKVTSATMG